MPGLPARAVSKRCGILNLHDAHALRRRQVYHLGRHGADRAKLWHLPEWAVELEGCLVCSDEQVQTTGELPGRKVPRASLGSEPQHAVPVVPGRAIPSCHVVAELDLEMHGLRGWPLRQDRQQPGQPRLSGGLQGVPRWTINENEYRAIRSQTVPDLRIGKMEHGLANHLHRVQEGAIREAELRSEFGGQPVGLQGVRQGPLF